MRTLTVPRRRRVLYAPRGLDAPTQRKSALLPGHESKRANVFFASKEISFADSSTQGL